MSGIHKHIILGAGGAIGKVLSDELLSKGEKVKLVSRRGYSIPGAESASADIADSDEIKNVIENSSTVYLIAGLPYNIKIWREMWPRIMRNVVEACKAKNARLIFFDNVYMYGKVDGIMTENSPIKPSSRKGEVRAEIANYLLSEMKESNIEALIARSADFYGPYADKTGLPSIFIFQRLADGKKAQCLVECRRKHSFTFTGDCGKALYLLATSENAFGQVWHLPTASPPLTGEQFIRLCCEKFGVPPRRSVMKKWMLRLGGIFMVEAKEIIEMLYQVEYDYIFDSSKFEKAFDFKPTPYERGIEETIKYLKSKNTI